MASIARVMLRPAAEDLQFPCVDFLAQAQPHSLQFLVVWLVLYLFLGDSEVTAEWFDLQVGQLNYHFKRISRCPERVAKYGMSLVEITLATVIRRQVHCGVDLGGIGRNASAQRVEVVTRRLRGWDG